MIYNLDHTIHQPRQIDKRWFITEKSQNIFQDLKTSLVILSLFFFIWNTSMRKRVLFSLHGILIFLRRFTSRAFFWNLESLQQKYYCFALIWLQLYPPNLEGGGRGNIPRPSSPILWCVHYVIRPNKPNSFSFCGCN